ncbi:MAG: DUF1688 family protein [Kofleriaceae bacterium]
MSEVGSAITYLRSPLAVRARCEQILEVGLAGKLAHFTVDLSALPAVIAKVVEVTRATYPDLTVPYLGRMSHFRAGGVDRIESLQQQMNVRGTTPEERPRALADLVVVSALLDTASNESWRFREPGTGALFARSEGIALASLQAFRSGLFSSDPDNPLRADANALRTLDPVRLAAAFQITIDNPLHALEERTKLVRALGGAVAMAPRIFRYGRPGGLVDALRATGTTLTAPAILGALIDGLGPIWPATTTLGEGNAIVALGDVWRHPAAGGSGPSEGFVPFHARTQWLAYSLFEPLEGAGFSIQQPGALTGIPEQRNGGLLVDLGVLVPRAATTRDTIHAIGDELVVEWRALTVALLDRVADGVQKALAKSPQELPLSCVLQGTWSAGRAVAAELRPSGMPPIRVADSSVL